MAGRPPKIDQIRDKFLNKITSAQSLVAAIAGLPRKVRQSAQIGIHPKYSLQITELAFMGVVSAWEEFLEQTLTRYVAGVQTSSGYRPIPKYGVANSILHAYELLSQDANYDPQKNYLKVSDPRWVWRTASFFFSQHPYTPLSNNSELLKRANHIRNRVAHDSEKCKADFKDASVWFIKPMNNNLKQGYGPGALLAETVQHNFNPRIVQAGQNHFEAYMQLYTDISCSIVPRV